MNKQELIEKLEEEKQNIIFFDGYDSHNSYSHGRDATYSRSIELAKQLDEPRKPVVPQFVADWFEERKDDLDFYIYDYMCMRDSQDSTSEFYRWFTKSDNKAIESLVRMKDGYEVEKEPLYVMPVPHVSFPVHYFVKDDHVSFRQGNAQKFTQAELDKYFPDIKQFAVPVEEV